MGEATSISRVDVSQRGPEVFDSYYVVDPLAQRAMLVEMSDYGPKTHVEAKAGYTGENLVATNEGLDGDFDTHEILEDHPQISFGVHVLGKAISTEVSPPIRSLEDRRQVAVAFAAGAWALHDTAATLSQTVKEIAAPTQP